MLNVRNKLAADRPNQLPAPPPDRRGCLAPSLSSRVLIIGLADGLASLQWSLSLAPNWQPSSNSIDATSHLTLATLWHYPRRDQTHSFCQVENLLAISLFSSSSSSSFVLFLIESALKIIRCVGEFNGLQMRFRKAKEREREKEGAAASQSLSIRFLQFDFNFGLRALLIRMKAKNQMNLAVFFLALL